MRVREIKRRLARNHGYGADELARMLDKKELIHALAYEEYKIHQAEAAAVERLLIKRGIIAAVVAVLLVLFWPLLSHVYEVALVNFVVYTDRKRHEASKCWEFKSIKGSIGVVVMAILDILGLWLTATVILSWVTTSKYFFPIPSLPIRPAQFMGGEISSGPMSRYGINTGPMLVTWTLRFLHGRLEAWVGRALLKSSRDAKKAKKKKKKQGKSEEEKAAKAARRAAREETRRRQKEEEESQQKEKVEQQMPTQQNEEPQRHETQTQQQQHTSDETNVPPFEEKSDKSVQNPPSREDARNAAAAAAEARQKEWNGFEEQLESHTAFDDLD